MEQNNKAFRLHLNLFDTVVILAALAVAAFLLWTQMKPADTAVIPEAERIQYTIVLRKTVPGTGAQVETGDSIVDAVKNFGLGKVISAEVVPAQDFAIDTENQAYVLTDVPNKEDVYITVESSATVTDEAVTLGSGYIVRVGQDIYVRGPGYLGSGRVYAIERGE